MFRKFSYTDVDGDHFPDAVRGSSLFYSIDTSCWLTGENDTLTSVDWELPEGVTSSEDYIESSNAIIKLDTPLVGSFELRCIINSTESGKTQTRPVPIMIKVY